MGAQGPFSQVVARGRAAALPVVVATLAASLAASCGEKRELAPGDLRMSVLVGLRRDDAGLAEAALRRSTPRDPTYMQWLTPAEMTAQFGASKSDAEAALSALTAAGFQGGLDPTGGVLVGEMTAEDASRFFGIDIVQASYGSSGTLAMPAKALAVPAALDPYATEVVGLVMSIDRDTTTTVADAADPPPEDPPCGPFAGLAFKTRERYRIQPLLDAGAQGQGVRMAMLQVSPTLPKALEVWNACRPIAVEPATVIHADASTREAFPDYAAESTLDILGAYIGAPALDGVDIYQVNPFAPVAVGLAAVLNEANTSRGLPALISMSLGFCEPQVRDAEIAVSERLLMGLSAMGTSVIASTGDFGSSACAPDRLDEAVQYPASSPWVTGVGGTTLIMDGGGVIIDELAWSQEGFAAGGGRTSRIPRPSWQEGIPFEGDNRIVPDVAFVADPSNFGPIPICDTAGTCTWTVNAGTSAMAPCVAGGVASMLSYLGKGDTRFRLGALNPGIYGVQRALAAAGGNPNGNYFDIVEGDNDAFGIGCCSAGPGYDAATGWGVVDFWDLTQRVEAVLAARP